MSLHHPTKFETETQFVHIETKNKDHFKVQIGSIEIVGGSKSKQMLVWDIWI